jgi:hypothetical protein
MPAPLAASSPPPGADTGERAGRDDGFATFVYGWNLGQGRGTPELHMRIARWLEQAWRSGDRRLLLMVFRDAGKSTLVGLFCAWLLAQRPELRILVMSADHALAVKMARNVRRILELHPDTRQLCPSQPEEWAADRFTIRRNLVQRDPSLLARGIGANITGSRADLIICDDVEVPATSDTPLKRETLRRVLRELSFVLVPSGLQLYIGTPHSYHSIYAAETRPGDEDPEPFLDGYTRLVIPLLDEQGRVQWPERFTAEVVEELRRRSGPAKFKSQMLLLPTNEREMRLDPSLLVRYEGGLELVRANGLTTLHLDGRRMIRASCWWDPAFGRSDRADASVIAAVFQDDLGGYWLHDLRYLRVDPAASDEPEALQLCRQVCAFLAANHIPVVTVESNGIGGFLPSLLRQALREAGLGVRVQGEASTRRKAQRILDAFDPVLAAGRLNAHAAIWRTPLIEEMREWRPEGRGRDDGLDAVAGCLLATPAHLPAIRVPGDVAAPQPGRGHLADTSFDI